METCPCGSQNSPDKCCNPEVPPIYAEAPRFVRSSALHTVDMPFSIKRYQVNYSVESGPGILSQVDPVIAEALGFDMTQVQLFSPSMRNTLVFPLHAVRYHLQQLMYRLRFLQKEVTQQVREAANDPRVQYFQCEDIALRSELESFVIRLAAYLDALAKYIAASIGASVKAHGSHNKMQNHLNGEVGRKRNEHQAIREVYAFHRDWIEQLLKVRHQVMHAGISMDMSISPNFFEERVFTPKLYGEAVESLIVTFWAETLEFTRSLIDLTKSIEP